MAPHEKSVKECSWAESKSGRTASVQTMMPVTADRWTKMERAVFIRS
jgi:hypothetical protein